METSAKNNQMLLLVILQCDKRSKNKAAEESAKTSENTFLVSQL